MEIRSDEAMQELNERWVEHELITPPLLISQRINLFTHTDCHIRASSEEPSGLNRCEGHTDALGVRDLFICFRIIEPKPSHSNLSNLKHHIRTCEL